MSREIAQKRAAMRGMGDCRLLDKWRAYLAVCVFHSDSYSAEVVCTNCVDLIAPFSPKNFPILINISTICL